MKEWVRKSGYIYLSLSILMLAILFAVAMVSLFWTEEKASNTTVGTVYLGDKSAQDYEISLLLGISEWKEKANFRISYNEYERNIPLDIFEFDVDTTIFNLVENQKNLAIFSLSEPYFSEFKTDIENYFGPVIYEALDVEKLFNDILYDAEKMSLQKTYTLYSYLNDELSKTSLNVSKISNIHSNDINEIISFANEIHIPANERFSLLDTIGSVNLSNEQMSIIASGIQSVIMPTSFSGIISQQYLDPPIWSESGKNVRILQVSKIDFSFFNPIDTDYIVKIEKKGINTLEFELIGFPFISEFAIESVLDNEISYQTEYLEDATIGPDTKNVIIIEQEFDTVYRILEQKGQSGSLTIFYRTITHPDGSSETSSILQEFVNPQNRIYRQNTVDKEDN